MSCPKFAPSCLIACVLALMLLACGGNDSEPPRMKVDATLAGACTVVCHKLGDCDALQGSPVEDCVRGCSREEAAAVSGGADACPISSEQANACVAAIDGFSCPALSDGDFPDACKFCEDRSARSKATAGAAAPKPGTTQSGCSELLTCCDQIAAPDQQSFCSMVVRMNNPGLCSAVLPTYRSAGACK